MAERESPVRTLKTRRSSTAACLLIAQVEERLSNQSAVLEDSDSFSLNLIPMLAMPPQEIWVDQNNPIGSVRSSFSSNKQESRVQ